MLDVRAEWFLRGMLVPVRLHTDTLALGVSLGTSAQLPKEGSWGSRGAGMAFYRFGLF